MTEPAATSPVVWKAAARTVVVAVLLVGAFAVLPLRDDRWWLGLGIGLAMVAALVPWAVGRVRHVAEADRPLVVAVAALLQLLTVLVVGFAAAYYALNHDGTQMLGLETRVDAVYFTVTTLSTVGFGDVVAVGQGARVLVTIQILFNLVFVGTAARVLLSAARRGQDAPALER
jgi:voltage-gated potassium channel